MTLQEERRQWEEQATQQKLPECIATARETLSGVPCLWIRNRSNPNSEGVVLYLHGGGLTSGSILTHRNFVARIAEVVGISFLMVEYRLLPENPFPAPLEDVLSVYRALIADRGLSSEKIILGGDSSGGGLALSALVKLREEGTSLPSKAFMISGVFDMTLSGETMQADAGKEPFLTLEDLKHWQQTYFEDLDSPLLSPYYADLSDLPPILLLAGEHELWLSDSVRVQEKLARCGSEAILRIWDSMTHVWVMDTGLEESNEALIEIRDFIHRTDGKQRERGASHNGG